MIVIRKAAASDAEVLPEIERSAAALFRQIEHLAWIADGAVQSASRHMELIDRGTAWVAADPANEPIGFLGGEVIDCALHIWELSVRSEWQGLGIGRKLVGAARQWAIHERLSSITLTTFRDVRWNEPFYRSLGFSTLQADEIAPSLARLLAAEADAGLAADERCAMIAKLA